MYYKRWSNRGVTHIGTVWRGVREGFKLSEILRVEFRVKFEGHKLREQGASPEVTHFGCSLFHLEANLTPITGPHASRHQGLRGTEHSDGFSETGMFGIQHSVADNRCYL